MAREPVLPAPLVTSSRCPRPSASIARACHAVRPLTGSAAACRGCSPDGHGAASRPHLIGPSPDRCQHLLADLLASTAHLGAHAAMLMHLRVSLTLVTAYLARLRARLYDRSGQVPVVPGLPGEQPGRRLAHVGAVQVQPRALDQVGDHLLAQVRVRACGACLPALQAGVDTTRQQLLVQQWLAWIRVQHRHRLCHQDPSTPGNSVTRHTPCGTPVTRHAPVGQAGAAKRCAGTVLRARRSRSVAAVVRVIVVERAGETPDQHMIQTTTAHSARSTWLSLMTRRPRRGPPAYLHERRRCPAGSGAVAGSGVWPIWSLTFAGWPARRRRRGRLAAW